MANNGKTSQAAFGAQARGTSAGQRARNVEVACTRRADVDGGGGAAAGSVAAADALLAAAETSFAEVVD